MNELKAGIGLSRKWDARDAGREVAETALEKLEGEKPKFFLLFSTIHYEKYGGFQELLNGVWEVLPEGTPLIGGTVAGFMNNYGCFTRGVTALAVFDSRMKAFPVIGKNVRKDPSSAARGFAGSIIKNGIKVHDFKSSYAFILVSGPRLINFPRIGRTRIIHSKNIAKMALTFAKLAHKKLQGGISREDEFLEELSSLLPNLSILLGTSVDDFRFMNNYQFFNKEVTTDSAVGLTVFSDMEIGISSSHGMQDTGIEFEITETDFEGFIINKINGKGAWPEYLKSLGWKMQDVREDSRFFDKVMYYPLGVHRKGKIVPIIPGIVIGDSMTIVRRVKEKEKASILTTSGHSLVNVVKECISPYKGKKLLFAIASSCVTRLLTLGKNVFLVHDVLKDFFDEVPFVSVYVAGEGIHSPPLGEALSQTMSFSISVFWKS